VYRNIRYTLDRGHPLQVPCGVEGLMSECTGTYVTVVDLRHPLQTPCGASGNSFEIDSVAEAVGMWES
jgi:hypothetical protein